jgi:hypothetical protein
VDKRMKELLNEDMMKVVKKTELKENGEVVVFIGKLVFGIWVDRR